jgi:hypothetical protein
MEAGAEFVGRTIGKARARAVLDAEAGGGELPEHPVEVPPIRGDRIVGCREASRGELRPLAAVVTLFQFAVGALEVVLIEAAVVGEAAVVVDFAYVQIGRLVVGVVPPPAPEES